MASVGAVACSLVIGDVPAKKTRGASWAVPGIDGTGAMTLGTGGEPGQFELHKYDSTGNCGIWIAAIEALKYTTVAVVNDWATTYSDFLITHVSAPVIEVALPYDTHAVIRIRGVLT